MKRQTHGILCAVLAAALLAGCGGPDIDATPAAPETDPTGTTETAPSDASSQSVTPAQQKPDLRPLTQGAGNAYYTFGSGQAEDGMHLILYAIDYDKQQAVPVCGKAGCSHDTPDCDAWLPDQNYRTIGSDGQEVFTLCTVVGSDEAYLERISPAEGDSGQTMARLPALEGQVFDWTLAAADDETVFLGAVHYDAQIGSGKPMIPAVAAVSRADGSMQLYDAPDEAAAARPDGNTVSTVFAGAQGRSLYFLVSLHDKSSSTQSGCELWAFDADAVQWNQVTGFEGKITNAGTEYYEVPQSSRAADPGRVVHVDKGEGSLRAVDLTTGEETTICTGLPAAPGEYDSYDVTRLENWYAVTVSQRDAATGQSQLQWFLVPAQGGDPVSMELYQYSDARGSQPVRLDDEYGGMFYCQYDMTNEPYTGVGKDGVAGNFDNYHILYGLIDVEDALASRPEYVQVFVE